jgi:hypothetical protein
MKYHIRHQFRDIPNYYVTSFFQKLYKTIETRFPQHTFEIHNDPSYENNGYGSIYSCMNFSIINPDTQNYIVVSFFDNWKYHFMKHLGWNPSKMHKFFYCGGFNYIDYFNFRSVEADNPDIDCPLNITNKYHSFFYAPYYDSFYKEINEIYTQRNVKQTRDLLHFRGYMWHFREDMVRTISDPSIRIIDKNKESNNLNYLEYLKELSENRSALSLPGGTEICNRDIECFAVGVPVLRPHLDINYPDPLISNYHYVNCFHACKYWDGNPWYLQYENFGDYVEYYWNLIKNNYDYLEFVSHNARQWYLKNCNPNNNIDYILSKFTLEDL